MLSTTMVIYALFQNNVIATSTGQEIANKAKALAWEENSAATSPTSTFTEAANAAGVTPSNDCLAFVKTVIIASGADTDYPTSANVYESDLVEYMNSSNKWEQINTTKESDLKTGDVLVSADKVNRQNHIFIYLGNSKVAAANLNDHYGRIENLSDQWWNGGKPFYYGDNKYKVFRVDSSSNNDSNSSSNSGKSQISESQLEEFAQNNILFYDPGECDDPGGPSSICGETAKEKYWTAIRQYFGKVQTAGIFGNVFSEGSCNPVGVESCTYLNPYDFSNNTWTNGWTWDRYFSNDCSTAGSHTGCPNGGKPTGVGAFGITSSRSEYLRYVNDNAPEVIKYFQDPGKYSFGGCSGLNLNGASNGGDALLEAIGDSDFNKLVEMDVYWMNHMIETHWDFDLDYFNNLTDASEAAFYFASHYERCDGCFDRGSATNANRMADAKKYYDEMGDFSCSSSSSSSSNSSSSNAAEITLIGDSIAVMAEKELESKFPSSFLTMVGSRHSTSGGACPGDKGGLEILKSIAEGAGTILKQHYNKNTCDNLAIDKDSLKENVVWELGTNMNGASKETIENVINIIGNNRNLFLVTPYNGYSGSKDDTEEIAKMYREIAENNDNVYIVDWADAVKNNEGTYVYAEPNMTVHPTDEGKKLLASLIYEAVSSNSSNCNSGKFVWYGQWLEPWANQPFGSSTIGAAGCGPTSFAMMATVLLGREITPTETAKIAGDAGMYVPGSGSSWDITEYLAEHYGLEYEYISVSSTEDAVNKITQHLKEGWMIHTSGGGSIPFTSGGHYIGIRGITSDGKWLLADSGHAEEYSTEYQWDPTEVVTAGMNISNIRAIRASSSINNSCDKPCNNDPKTTGTSGFSSAEEAAAVVITDYKSMSSSELGSAYGLALPDTGDYHDNCVAFSTWFINHYTNISYTYPPDGNMLVDDFYSKNKSKYPDMTIDKEPSVYSVASWSVPTLGTASGNHTGIVVGIDKTADTILIAEAGWNSPGFTGVHSYNLSEATGSVGYQYINLNNYLKSSTGLK